MNRVKEFKCLVVVVLLLGIMQPLAAMGAENLVLIKFRPLVGEIGRPQLDTTRLQALSLHAGVSLRHLRSMAGNAEVLSLPEGRGADWAERIVERLRTAPGVVYAVLDRRYYPLRLPNDPMLNNQWHYLPTLTGNEGGANITTAWDTTVGDPDVVVAVIDTGILDHEDLAPARIAPGYDFIFNTISSNDGDGRDSDPHDPGDWLTLVQALACGTLPRDSSWHGSHVAGTIGADSDNSLGVAGATWQGKLLPLRVMGKCGGLLSDIVDAMYWAGGLAVPDVPANPTPAQVVNLSLGGLGACTQVEQDAINALRAAGVSVVVAAGNENQDAQNSSPANCDGVISVAAHGESGQRAYYSNYGEVIDISAPGGDQHTDVGILSTVNGGTKGPEAGNDDYVYYQGSSMAAPLVSGVVALMHASHRSAGYTTSPLTPAQVERGLKQSATALPSDSDCQQRLCGAGLIDAQAAVLAVNGIVAPVADAGVAQSVASQAAVQLDGSASSDDGQIVSYSWLQDSTDLPQVSLTGANTVNPGFTAPAGVAMLDFTLTVTDDEGLQESASVRIAVANSAPQLQGIGNREAAPGEPLIFSINATDSDLPDETLHFQATDMPADAYLTDNGDGSATFTWSSAGFTAADSYNTGFTVTDSGGLSAGETILISELNVAPILAAIGPRSGVAGTPLSFTISATDANGGKPTLTATGLPTGASFIDSGKGSGSFSWISPLPGSYDITFNAIDAVDTALVDSEVVNLSISAAPVVNSGGGGAFGTWLLLLLSLIRLRIGYSRPKY